MPTTIQLGHNTGDDYTGGLTVCAMYASQATTHQSHTANFCYMNSYLAGDEGNVLIVLDTAPSLGGTVYVTAADLEMYVYDVTGVKDYRVSICLQAADATAATWNKYDGVTDWATAGGLGSADIGGEGFIYDWATTTSRTVTPEGLAQAVQDFLNGVTTQIGFVAHQIPWNVDDGQSTKLMMPAGSTTLGPRLNVTYSLVPDGTSPNSDVTTTGWSSTGGSFHTEVGEGTLNLATYVTSPDIADDTGSSPLVLGLSGTSDNGDVLVQINSKCVTTEARLRVLLLDSGGTAQATSKWFAPPIGDYTYDIVLTPTADVVKIKIEKRLTRPVPAYYTALTSGQWHELPRSTFFGSKAWWAQVDTSLSVGGYGPEYTYTAWNSFVINTVGCYYEGRFHWGTFLMFAGAGGHTNWYGTGVIVYGPFDDDWEEPDWHIAIEHLVPGPVDVARSGSTPTAHHIYQSQQHDAATNRLIGLTTPGYSSVGNSSNASNALDCYTNTWSALADATLGGEPGVDAVTCIDGTYFWMLPYGNGVTMTRVTLSNDARSTWTKDFPESRYGLAAGLHPTASVMAWSDGTTVWAFDLRDPTTNVRYTPTCTGTPPGSTNGLSLSWNVANSRFECKTSASNRTLHHITPGADPYPGGDDWVWSSTTPGSGTTPVAEATGSGGQYGKAQWLNGVVPGMVYAPDPTAPIYIYKP